MEHQAKFNKRMVDAHARKNKISIYNVGDNVLVQNPKAKTKRGKRLLTEIPAFEGKIVCTKGLRYKVQYETDVGEHVTDWFPVSSITSLTRASDKRRTKILSRSEVGVTKDLDHEVSMTEPMELLVQRLSDFGLMPQETIGDGNCFFRAVSSMLYTTDEHYDLIRQQAVERVNDNPEQYQDFILQDYNSVEEYTEIMSEPGYWADNAIVRATADALNVQIQVILQDKITFKLLPG